ncbi:MAG TPA: hypothetical protein VIT67_14300 [Povalibacter sp.]
MSDEKNAQDAATPWHLWVVGGLALAWNGMGTYLWGGTTFMPDKFLAELSAAHRDYVSSLPIWSTFTWGLGVVGGVVGSVLLLLRHRLAVHAFALSLAGAVTNTMVYVTNPPPGGFFNLPLTIFIIGFAIFLLWFAHFSRRRDAL